MYIYKAAVIGAGTMGAEIAQTISYSGLPTLLKDVDEACVRKGVEICRRIYRGRVDKGKMSASEMEAKLALISPVTSYDGFGEVDLVIEAVPEQLALKERVLQELDRACPPSTILASNTSSLSISALGAATGRPHKVVGLHFFYPAHVMKLVEVIPGLDTSAETVDDVTSFAGETLRKIPVRVAECAGFLVNRLLMPYLNEAAFCLEEGVASIDAIDRAVVAFGMPMGPFTLVDNIGLDVCAEVVEVLLAAFGERMTPAALWGRMAAAGRFGRKRGKGFYNYSGDDDASALAALLGVSVRSGPEGAGGFNELRVLLPMINEAAICLQEQVAAAADIDVALLAGIGFPQNTGGLLRYADTLGIDAVLRALEESTARYGARFRPAPLLRRMVAAKHLGRATGKGFFEYR